MLILVFGCYKKITDPIDSSIVFQSEQGGEILVSCTSGMIEVGIKSEEAAFSEELSSLPLGDMKFLSTVKVFDKQSGSTITNSISQHPVVYWKDKDGEIEYVGLHEIEIEDSDECRDYLFSIQFKKAPTQFFSGDKKNFTIYARRSMRP